MGTKRHAPFAFDHCDARRTIFRGYLEGRVKACGAAVLSCNIRQGYSRTGARARRLRADATVRRSRVFAVSSRLPSPQGAPEQY